MEKKTADELLTAAFEACKNSYSPYSGFPVGAAVLTPSGRIFAGTNIENASYGATMCAERTAVFKAVSEGEREILALAVVTTADSLPIPCGMCLQVLSEFAADIPVLLKGKNAEQSCRLSDLLPQRFDKNSL